MGRNGVLVVLVFLHLEPSLHPTAWKIAVGEHLLKVTNQTHSDALGREHLPKVPYQMALR